MQKILTNIAKGFVLNKLIDKKKCFDLINKILIENDEKKISILKFESNKFEIKKHLKYIDNLRKYFAKKYNTKIEIENKINKTLGNFIPSQDEINLKFDNTDKYDKLLLISLLAYYVKVDKNELNIWWNHSSKYGKIKISINKGKPEKTQAQIIAEKNSNIPKNSSDPKCPICIENINFKGSLIKDSRENLRVVFVELEGNKSRDWFFQYSPYAYVNKHFVLNSIKHQPMIIDNSTIKNLISFIDKNENFFIGSNADLPIIGGSLLGHNHYQGGQDTLPIMNAKSLEKLFFKAVEINILKWPLNAIKLSSENKNEIINVSNFFINEWKSNSSYNLESFNNSTTIITKKNNKVFEAYLIFRNNSTSQTRPFGNFHINHSKFNIKQENIGLMEAAGLAILPARLEKELQEIIEIHDSQECRTMSDENFIDFVSKNNHLTKHTLWLSEILKNNIKINRDNLLKEVSNVFVSCLEDCRVLDDEQFIEFIKDKIKYNQEVYSIRNKTGLFIEIINKGFTIKQIKLNDENFLLEYKNINSYFDNNDILLNSFVGPVAGRIEKGLVKFKKNNLHLKTDNMNNYIHGMSEKWSDLIFDIQIISYEEFDLVIGTAKQHNIELNCDFLIKISLKIWKNKNEVNFEYIIKTNRETICNPTQHYYWSLPRTKNIFNLNINMKSKNYWTLNNNFNPDTREKLENDNFVNISRIREQIGHSQALLVNNGIDHPIELLEGTSIILSSSDFKHTLKSRSTLNSIVMYSHNWKSSNELMENKDSINSGLCIEYQEIPTSLKNPNFEKIIINENNPYVHSVTYEFKKEN